MECMDWQKPLNPLPFLTDECSLIILRTSLRVPVTFPPACMLCLLGQWPLLYTDHTIAFCTGRSGTVTVLLTSQSPVLAWAWGTVLSGSYLLDD